MVASSMNLARMWFGGIVHCPVTLHWIKALFFINLLFIIATWCYKYEPQRWKWVSGSWVMGQMGHHFWMGHVGHGSLPFTHWPMIIKLLHSSLQFFLFLVDIKKLLTHSISPIAVDLIGSRALSFSDPYIHFACLSVRHSFCHSFCHSVCPQLRS